LLFGKAMSWESLSSGKIPHEFFLAQSAPGKLEEVLSGFDEEEKETDSVKKTLLDEMVAVSNSEDSGWLAGFGGKAGTEISCAYEQEAPVTEYHPDWRGLRRLRSFLQLTWERKFLESTRVYVQGKIILEGRPDPLSAIARTVLADKNQEAFDEYQEGLSETELREAYLQTSLADFMDLKLGKQIITWGMADTLGVLDVLNPRDNRVPGLVDVEDARIPLNASRANFFIGDWNLSLVVIHEIRFSKSPGYGSEFYAYPLPENFGSELNLFPEEKVPSSGGDNSEYGLALKAAFSGWDLSLNHADYFDDQARTVWELKQTPLGTELKPKSRVHDRLRLSGAGISVVVGSWLWKMEYVLLSGFQFYGTEKSYQRADLVFALEYAGISDAYLTAEVSEKSILDFEAPLAHAPNNAFEHTMFSAFSYRQDFLNQSLHLNAFALLLGEKLEKGGTARLGLTYDWFDASRIGGGLLVYQKGEDSEYTTPALLAYVRQISKNDRIFLEADYSF